VLRKGVEAQAQVEQGNWQFDTSYSTVRMDCIGCPDMFTATKINEPLLSAPADKFGVGAGYNFRSIDLQVGANAQFVSAQRNLSERYLLAGYGTPAYDVYGLNMTWSPKVQEVGQVEVGLGISNLLDTKYTVHNSGTGTFELGRNYSLSLAAIF
jgi:outer membrane receptor protein involved in Fe transport